MSTGDTETYIGQKSKGLSDEGIKSPIASFNILVSNLKWIHNSKLTLEFTGNCLKQDKATFTHGNVEICLLSMY